MESFTYPGNKRRIFVALFGIAAGLTVIWYTAMFSGLAFIKATMHVEDTTAEIIVGIAALIGTGFYVLFGHLSDKWGRKKPIIMGYVLTLLLLFQVFWVIGSAGERAGGSAPWTISGPDCSYDAFAKVQATNCGRLMGDFTGAGIAYTLAPASRLGLAVGDRSLDLSGLDWADAKARKAQIEQLAGIPAFSAPKVKPALGQAVLTIGALLVLMALSGASYGPVAALLAEMFPARVRYSSMSIPYHIGTGYFGGFLPLISTYIVAKTGNPYSGLWYTWGVVLMAFLVAAWGLKGGPPRDFGDESD